MPTTTTSNLRRRDPGDDRAVPAWVTHQFAAGPCLRARSVAAAVRRASDAAQSTAHPGTVRSSARARRTVRAFRVERDVLADAVAWTARSLPARPPVPVLAGLLLEADSEGR